MSAVQKLSWAGEFCSAYPKKRILMVLSTEHGMLEPFLHPRHLISLSDNTAHKIQPYSSYLSSPYATSTCSSSLLSLLSQCPCPSLFLVTKLWIQEATTAFLSQNPQYWPSKRNCSSFSPPSHSRRPVCTACIYSIMASSKSFFCSLTVLCPSASVPFLRLFSIHLCHIQLRHLWENVYIDTALTLNFSVTWLLIA